MAQEKNNNSGSVGCGLLGVLQIIFIVMKLTVPESTIYKWSWIEVLIPLWISLGCCSCLCICLSCSGCAYFASTLFEDPIVEENNKIVVKSTVKRKQFIIENNVFIGPSVVFTNVINPRSFIERKNEFKKTFLLKGCSIGANATIICGNKIGKYSLIGAGSVVNRAVKDFELVVGNPIRHIGWVDIEGNRLRFNNEDKISVKGRTYELNNNKVTLLK